MFWLTGTMDSAQQKGKDIVGLSDPSKKINRSTDQVERALVFPHGQS